ncbi:MAG: hypothetical protein GY944_06000 [bacterium]|nr:hypothetical protein [bacterium]
MNALGTQMMNDMLALYDAVDRDDRVGAVTATGAGRGFSAEALTAKDRPYKPGMTLSQSLSILEQRVERGQIDRSLYDLFVSKRLYLGYAADYMAPHQIDGEHRDALVEMTSPWS